MSRGRTAGGELGRLRSGRESLPFGLRQRSRLTGLRSPGDEDDLAVGGYDPVRPSDDDGERDARVADPLDFTLGLQMPGGEIRWARGVDGRPAEEALLTGCSSMFHSLRCALELARLRDDPQPDWELAATTLGHAVVAHEDWFSPRQRYSMDWYYPILGGALRGRAADERIDTGWDRFVVPGLGLLCVSDRPWVTGAETCELVLALCAIDQPDRAGELFASMQHLRHEDGSYWTGYVYTDDARWPVERTTWTAGAVLLASAALGRDPVTTFVFGGADLPVGPDEIMRDCDASHDLRPA